MRLNANYPWCRYLTQVVDAVDDLNALFEWTDCELRFRDGISVQEQENLVAFVAERYRLPLIT